MKFGSTQVRTCLLTSIFALIMLLGFAPDTQAIDRLRVTVGDTTGASGEQNSVVSVFMTNTMDDIQAFTLHLTLARNDIANFQTQLDTVIDSTYWICADGTPAACNQWEGVDSPFTYPWDSLHVDTVEAWLGNFDTTGSLISGWEMVTSRAVSTGDYGLDILVTAIADQEDPPAVVPPISPQNGGLLFRILADIFDIPTSQEDRTVAVQIDISWKPYFVFSTPVGEAVGWISVEVPDTNYYMCTLPDPGGCGEWTKVPLWQCPDEICDSVAIDTVEIAVLDDEQVSLFDGSITVENWVCGDVTGEGNVSIGDISLLIDHMFINEPPIDPIEAGNVNCSTEVPIELTIGDLSVLIDHLFINMQPLCCE
jgi:hypothetical protein